MLQCPGLSSEPRAVLQNPRHSVARQISSVKKISSQTGGGSCLKSIQLLWRHNQIYSSLHHQFNNTWKQRHKEILFFYPRRYVSIVNLHCKLWALYRERRHFLCLPYILFSDESAGWFLSERVGSVRVETCQQTIFRLSLSHKLLKNISKNKKRPKEESPSYHWWRQRRWFSVCQPLSSADQHRAELVEELSSVNYYCFSINPKLCYLSWYLWTYQKTWCSHPEIFI